MNLEIIGVFLSVFAIYILLTTVSQMLRDYFKEKRQKKNNHSDFEFIEEVQK